MRLARSTPLASMGLLLFVASGCYSPYQPSPYGSPYGYPQAPVQTLTPGNQYVPTVPNGTYSTPTPADQYNTPTSPGTSTFQPQGSASGQSPFFNQSNSAPPYSEGGGVPKPFDAGDSKFNQSTPPIANEQKLDEFGALEGAGAQTESVAKIAVDTAEFFEPIRSSGRKSQPRPFQEIATVPGAQAPYAYDAQDYRWLRGIAVRNETTGVWSLIYCTKKAELDRYQGWLTIAADPRLEQLEANGAYLISGQLDESRRDSAGKPTYRMQSLSAWKPSATF